MQRCAFTPYEGNEPYIFISYAHKDSKRVYPILEELNRRGYRVWYDDGIAPGSEWPENIAQHLSGCALTLAFISPSSIASDNCRREVTFALSKRKPFLGIILEPTEMSLGMEMQLSAQQCIMKYSYVTEESFYSKVCSCPDLQPCLKPPVQKKEQPAAEPVQPVSVPQPKQQPVPVQPKAPAQPLDKKMIGIIAGAAAAVVLLVVILIGVFSGGGNDNTDPSDGQLNDGTGQKPGTTDTTAGSQSGDSSEEIYLVYADQAITAEDIAYISKQTKLDKLEMHNCVIQTMEGLTLANTVTEVQITDCTGVTDLHFLSTLENLVTLDLSGSDVKNDALSDLSSKELFSVDMTGNTEFSDLSVFADCTGIHHIYFSNTSVSSVEVLANMADLATVSGSNTQVKDITPLAALTELLTLEFANCGIGPIETPFYSLHLQTLDLSWNLLDNLDFLDYCTTLKDVNVSYNELNDLDPLAKSTATLESLNVSGNSYLYEWELEYVPECAQLKTLRVDGLYLNDLEFLRGATGLEKLSAVNCSLDDITALENITHLSYLNLSSNYIDDISVLANMAAPYMILDLSFNSLMDVSALPVSISYHVLNLAGNDLDEYTIPAVYGTDLVVTYAAEFEDSDCMDETNRTIFTYVSVVDCPLDKVVAMENRFGADRVKFLSEVEDYILFLEERQIDCTCLWWMIQQ